MERKMMSDQPKVRVLLLESIHPDAVSRLEEDGFQVESLRNALDEVELIERISGVNLLGIRSKTQVTAKVPTGSSASAPSASAPTRSTWPRRRPVVSRCSTPRSRTPARWWSWRSPRSSR
jgi:hypothetical protein